MGDGRLLCEVEKVSMNYENCTVCLEIAKGERNGVCLSHGLLRFDDGDIKRFAQDAEKKSQSVARRYVIRSFEPKVDTIPEEVSEKTYLRIQSMKEQLGVRSLEHVVDYLVKEMAFRHDPAKAIQSHTPLIITGPPASGKTTLCKSILKNFEKIFIVDVSHEYDGLDIVNTGDLLGNVWQSKTKFRVYPADNPLYSNMEMNFTFGILLGKMKEPNSPLKDFVFVIEDAVRFSDIQSVRSFIAESRKFIRKCIVVCQDPRAYEGFGEVLKP